MDFYTLFPNLEPWVQNLAGVWPASVIKPSIWMFAAIEAVHLLTLGLLGGCVILLNFRLLGIGLTSEPVSVVERNLRLWLWIGVGGVLLTGIAIGMSNAEKLYTSPAFSVKMVSLAAGLIFSFGVTNSIARSEGGSAPGRKSLQSSPSCYGWRRSECLARQAEQIPEQSIWSVQATPYFSHLDQSYRRSSRQCPLPAS